LRQKKKKEVAKEAKQLKENGDRRYREKWKVFFDMEKRFDNVTHALCLTAHSAQGSSIDNVFLYAREMKYCGEKQQILYTSLTRAKTRCYVCQ
jgi:ATP-dependent exoDNAse (exonuclease V) alpha subunit